MGDNRRVWMTEQCTDVPIRLGPYSILVDALVYDLGSLDLILGIAWLRTLGTVLCNWSSRSIQFWSGGVLVKLQLGISTPHEGLSSLLSCIDEQGDTPTTTTLTDQLSTTEQTQLDYLLINIVEGQDPICVRPYRYPHLHNDEIQRQVQEMLEQGIIRPSQSAFSSPMIRLCIDYQALNRVTILDKYLILVVEELLDEFRGGNMGWVWVHGSQIGGLLVRNH
ncbi:hypothetical protein LXL04_004090 [Taraxacum kok-saghyz]